MRAILAVFLVLSVSLAAEAQLNNSSREDLLLQCQEAVKPLDDPSRDQFLAGLCLGYIRGVVDIHSYVEVTADYSRRLFRDCEAECAEAVSQVTRKPFCLNRSVTDKQLARVVVEYTEAHPAYVDVTRALTEAFPCPEEEPRAEPKK